MRIPSGRTRAAAAAPSVSLYAHIVTEVSLLLILPVVAIVLLPEAGGF